jgi:hypothetical protein
VPVPTDLSPAQFFTSYLPAEWARARAGKPAAADATFEVVLDGDDGGTWAVTVAKGELTAREGAAAAPDLRVRMSATDFRAALQGEDGAPDIFPREIDLGAAIARIPSGAPGVQMMKGAVTIGITGFHGRTWTIALESGGASTPSASVTIDADTIVAMKHGKIDPASAFFGGKIQLGGDVAWAMQLGMGYMQRRGPSN